MTSSSVSPAGFAFDNSYARDLEGFYAPGKAETAPSPRILIVNDDLARELSLDPALLRGDAGAAILSGNAAIEGASPLSQVYAGHQFGGFSPQLGDGRALLLGEVIDINGNRRDIQFKGSGRTPFSRGGDGKAAVGPVLREYLIGEAMYALGIPTTRALAAVATGEDVFRETPLPGAILTRVAASHIRVGTFQFFAARQQTDMLRRLLDYSIARHYPAAAEAENPALAFLEAVMDAQASLVAKWMNVGFIHGVMNTDNMTISGETIDYGPCAFMDYYDPGTVFSSIDANGRYAYVNQPPIAQWNLARLAETLIPLVHDDEEEATRLLTNAVNGFPAAYIRHWLEGARAKLGLATAEEGDLDLINGLFSAMEGQSADFTLVFRNLSNAVGGDDTSVRALFEDAAEYDAWAGRWRDRLARESRSAVEVAAGMDAVNPIYIPRNHRVEEALSAAVERDDLAPFEKLLAVLQSPFAEIDGLQDYTQPAPADAFPYQTFCGT